MLHQSEVITNTRKLGNNRGKLRLWLEGNILSDAGFIKGVKYDIVTVDDTLMISIKEDGKRIVAGTPVRPIIDINSTTKLECLGDVGDVVEVSVIYGHIAISKQEN